MLKNNSLELKLEDVQEVNSKEQYTFTKSVFVNEKTCKVSINKSPLITLPSYSVVSVVTDAKYAFDRTVLLALGEKA